MFRVAKQDGVIPAGIGNITVSDGLNDTQEVKVRLLQAEYSIVNLQDKKDKNSKPYQLGDMVYGNVSYATVMVRNANIKKTGEVVPMVTLYIKSPELKQKLGIKNSLWALIENGRGSLSENKDHEQGQQQGGYGNGNNPPPPIDDSYGQ